MLDPETLKAYMVSNRAAAVAVELGALAEEARTNLGRFASKGGRHRRHDNSSHEGRHKTGSRAISGGNTGVQNELALVEVAQFTLSDLSELGRAANAAAMHSLPANIQGESYMHFNPRSI